MAAGFEFRQSLSGAYHRLSAPGEEHPIQLDLHAKVPFQDLMQQQRGRLLGELRAPGFAARSAIEGTVGLALRDAKLVYDFRFAADDGRPRRFHGETEIHFRRFVRTLEDVVGRVYDDEHEEARVILRVPVGIGVARILRTLRTGFTSRL